MADRNKAPVYRLQTQAEVAWEDMRGFFYGFLPDDARTYQAWARAANKWDYGKGVSAVTFNP